jgi:pimeloyl-ACP methyl ester carboxylesterase
MPDTRTIATASALCFDAWVDGPESGALVLLLHGFPQSRHSWRAVLPALAHAGHCAVAPDQRGYSAGARPDPADLANYAYDRLVDDVIAIAAALGRGATRFHLVGHDWGGQVAWGVAHRHPARLASLAILSRPHPAAFVAALERDPEQAHRSRHHRNFLDPETGARLLADDATLLREMLAAAGVPAAAIDEYLSVLGTPAALEAALAWYRAREGLRVALGPIAVPTLYIWGDQDQTVGRMAAEGTASFVSAPYRFESLPGVGHYSTDQAPAPVTQLLLEHLARHPAPTPSPR